MNVSTNRFEKKHMILDLSVVQRNPHTLQVCDQVYENCPPSFLDTSELFYESRAMYVFLSLDTDTCMIGLQLREPCHNCHISCTHRRHSSFYASPMHYRRSAAC